MVAENKLISSTVYAVQTPVYEGPLDLLLYLIERAELDITKLALALVTDQYLKHLEEMKENLAGEVSAFLVIATKLIQIKSEVLLPRPPTIDKEEADLGELLTRQLLVYKEFKEKAEFLNDRELADLRTYLRLSTQYGLATHIELSDYSLSDILEAARRILIRIDTRKKLDTVVSSPKITIREKISYISSYLGKFKKSTFKALLKPKSTSIDIVVTFLAMLELIKGHLIIVTQSALFGEINIETSNLWSDYQGKELDVEFEE